MVDPQKRGLAWDTVLSELAPNISPDLSNLSHSVVISPSVSRNIKKTLQSRFLHRVAPYLSNGILPPLIVGPPSSTFILGLLPFPSIFLSPNRVFALHARKLLWKKQDSLSPTEVHFRNFVLLSVAPSIPIMRG